jgi:hypothetical protein
MFGFRPRHKFRSRLRHFLAEPSLQNLRLHLLPTLQYCRQVLEVDSSLLALPRSFVTHCSHHIVILSSVMLEWLPACCCCFPCNFPCFDLGCYGGSLSFPCMSCSYSFPCLPVVTCFALGERMQIQRQRQNRKVAVNSSDINSNNKYIPDWDTADLVWKKGNHLKL